jgi:hypothetical protein
MSNYIVRFSLQQRIEHFVTMTVFDSPPIPVVGFHSNYVQAAHRRSSASDMNETIKGGSLR